MICQFYLLMSISTTLHKTCCIHGLPWCVLNSGTWLHPQLHWKGQEFSYFWGPNTYLLFIWKSKFLKVSESVVFGFRNTGMDSQAISESLCLSPSHFFASRPYIILFCLTENNFRAHLKVKYSILSICSRLTEVVLCVSWFGSSAHLDRKPFLKLRLLNPWIFFYFLFLILFFCMIKSSQ